MNNRKIIQRASRSIKIKMSLKNSLLKILIQGCKNSRSRRSMKMKNRTNKTSYLLCICHEI